MTDTPVALFIYNRPQITEHVFEAIKTMSPPRLIVVADGPKNAADATQCEAARTVAERVDWPCEVIRVYSDVNLGCKRRVSSGLAAVFELYERAIILEDDCVPDLSFYKFASELLFRYENDDRVTTICGSSFVPIEGPFDYAFSRFSLIWGWASWRRAWRHYDLGMSSWPRLRNTSWLKDILRSSAGAYVLTRQFDYAASGELDTWDTQWLFSSLVRGGHCIIPARNLVTNIGCGAGATHTRDVINQCANVPRSALRLPIHHPLHVRLDDDLDKNLLKWIWRPTIYDACKMGASSVLNTVSQSTYHVARLCGQKPNR